MIVLTSVVSAGMVQDANVGDGTEASDPVVRLVESLSVAGVAPLAGRKDKSDTIGPMKIGYALWDTGEFRAGYNGGIAELVLEDQDVGGKNDSKYAKLDMSGGNTTTISDVATGVYPSIFEAPWAKFSFPGDLFGTTGIDRNNDFQRAFVDPASANVNFFATQNTIYSPHTLGLASEIDMLSSYPFFYVTNVIAKLAVAHGLAFTQNIGFANNHIFVPGQFDQNVSFPLISKHEVDPDLKEILGYDDSHTPSHLLERQPRVFERSWVALEPDPAIVPNFKTHPASIVHPEIAALVGESINERIGVFPDVTQYPAMLPTYHSVGGEYFIRDSPLLDGDGKNILKGDRVPGWIPSCAMASISPCNPCDVINVDSYTDCLPNTDYSNHSYTHFHKWLERRYGTPGAAASSWGMPPLASCTTFASCSEASLAHFDPLLVLYGGPSAAAGQGIQLERVAADWGEFGDDQLAEAHYYQYRVAKSGRVDELMYNFEFGAAGADRAAQHSDGVALGNWYLDNRGRLDIVAPMKKMALHGVSYGESLNFPIFGMPRVFESPSGKFQSCIDPSIVLPPDLPDTFLPPCWDFEFSNRTLREFLTLGVDSLGLAYWENASLWSLVYTAPGLAGGESTISGADFPVGPPAALGLASGEQIGIDYATTTSYWTLKNGLFSTTAGVTDNMVQIMADEVFNLSTRRAVMTPWRSPLLIHVGEMTQASGIGGLANGPYVEGMTNFTTDSLARLQIQYAPFLLPAGLQDLWLSSAREALLSPFVLELSGAAPDLGLVSDYTTHALANDWNLLILVELGRNGVADPFQDQGLFQALAGMGLVTPGDETAIHSAGLCIGWEIPMAPGNPSLDWTLVGLSTEPDEVTESRAYLEEVLFTELEAITSTSIRPVYAKAVGSQGCRITPAGDVPLVPDIALTVMSDGINLLVTVANTGIAPQSLELEVDCQLAQGPIGGHAFEGGPVIMNLGEDDGMDKSGGKSLGSEVRLALGLVNVSDAAGISLDAINTQLTAAVANLNSLRDLQFEVDAGFGVLVEMASVQSNLTDPPLSVDAQKLKLLAGLVRLERMMFLKYAAQTLEVFDRYGNPIPGTTLQLEFPMQNHARRDGPAENAPGMFTITTADLMPPGSGGNPVEQYGVWNFGVDLTDLDSIAPETYWIPTWPGSNDPHVVEFHVQHPTYETQAVWTQDLTR